MTDNPNLKVTAGHLKRNAYLYVRQSTLHQVHENAESAERQYALRQRAIELGWRAAQIAVIDRDQGKSGTSADGRKGFQELVAAVGMGKAGIVMGLEVSRLARNSADWHRLLEICALSDTLILDEDGLYDPRDFNNRILLGLKGTMSEAELHFIRARLQGGLMNKARRGELRLTLPTGFVYDAMGKVLLDPDKQIQEILRMVFKTYRRVGSASMTVKTFREQGLRFPCRTGDNERHWDLIHLSQVLQILHNPVYAGAYVYGRKRSRKTPNGTVVNTVPQDQWQILIQGAHEGYISWEEYEENQRRLEANRPPIALESYKSAPREGSALLQGLAICGRCGRSMTVRYDRQGGKVSPVYECSNTKVQLAKARCLQILGTEIDKAISQVVIEVVTPMTLEVALAVEQELKGRLQEADLLRQRQVEGARYQAELARRRYMQVDPDNRLVADSLEQDWNKKLQALHEAEQECERGRRADRMVLDDRQRQQILNLATDFPRIWNDPAIPHRERKRMLRLVIEDVTLNRDKEILVQIRFKGGATKSLTLPLPKNFWQMRLTPPGTVKEVDRLVDNFTDKQIATILNERGFRPGARKDFDSRCVVGIRHYYGLKNRRQRLKEKGLWDCHDVARFLGVTLKTVRTLRRQGQIISVPLSSKLDFMYEPLEKNRVYKVCHGNFFESFCHTAQ